MAVDWEEHGDGATRQRGITRTTSSEYAYFHEFNPTQLQSSISRYLTEGPLLTDSEGPRALSASRFRANKDRGSEEAFLHTLPLSSGLGGLQSRGVRNVIW
jgi:hypothetical protein